MAFHEVQFPTDISKGSSGGPERRTDIVTLRSGFEQRNNIWAHSRRRYDASLGLRDVNDLHDVISFFEARSGRLHGFRWKDWTDFKSGPPRSIVSATDQQIGVGDGENRFFGLTKTYTSGQVSYQRQITKPVEGSVRLGVSGAETFEAVVETDTGWVTFLSPPPPGSLVTAGFEFDVSSRFDTEHLVISVDALNAGTLPSIEIVELADRRPTSPRLTGYESLYALLDLYPASWYISFGASLEYSNNNVWGEGY